MKNKVVTILMSAVTTLALTITSFAATFELKSDSSYKFDNPLKGKNSEEVTIEYTITQDASAAANGWDGIMSFYNPDTLGRVSIQTHPYVCWNSVNAKTGWIDYKANTLYSAKGETHSFKIVINKDSITMYKDGEVIESGMTGSSASDLEPIEVSYQNILDAINEYEQFYVGVGSSTYSYWLTEICTLTDVKINGEEMDPDKVSKETDPTLGKPEKNTADYGATTTEESDSSFTVGIVVAAVVIVVAVVAALAVVSGKKKKNKEQE